MPVVWLGGGQPLALPLMPGYDAGRAYSIHAGGAVVGSIYSSAAGSTSHRAALWRPDQAAPGSWLAPVLLGTLGGNSRALRTRRFLAAGGNSR